MIGRHSGLFLDNREPADTGQLAFDWLSTDGLADRIDCLRLRARNQPASRRGETILLITELETELDRRIGH